MSNQRTGDRGAAVRALINPLHLLLINYCVLSVQHQTFYCLCLLLLPTSLPLSQLCSFSGLVWRSVWCVVVLSAVGQWDVPAADLVPDCAALQDLHHWGRTQSCFIILSFTDCREETTFNHFSLHLMRMGVSFYLILIMWIILYLFFFF